MYLVSGEELIPVFATELPLAAVLGVNRPRPVGDIVGICPSRLHVIDIVDAELSQRSPHTYQLSASPPLPYWERISAINAERKLRGVEQRTQCASSHQSADDHPHGHNPGIRGRLGHPSV